MRASIYWLLTLLLLAALSPIASAATVEVPGTHATIQAAINAAADGDTIRINDSASYNGELQINKRINLVAASGQTPTLTNDGNATNRTLIALQAGSNGTRIGSNDGGRLNVVFDTGSTGWTSGDDVILGLDNSITSVTVENISYVRNDGITSATVGNVRFIRDTASVARTVTINDCSFNINDAVSGNQFFYLGGDGDTLPGTLNPNVVYNFNNCSFSNMTGAGSMIIMGAWQYNINLDNCELGTGNERQASLLKVFDQGCKLSVTNSILRAGDAGNSDAMIHCRREPSVAGATVEFDFSNSILAGTNRALIQKGGFAGYTITIDHCDLVLRDPTSVIMLASSGGNANITVTNTNLVGLSEHTGTFVSITRGTGNLVFTNNNAFATGSPTYYSPDVAAVVANSYSLNPNYSGNVYEGNAVYTDATLLVGSTSGGPIGSMGDAPPPPPSVNRARDWTRY